MGRLSKKELSQIIQDKLADLDRLHELHNKVELIESEIIALIGEDFNPEEFFGDDGTAALNHFEKEVGDDFTPLGTFEDPNAFISDLDSASDEEAERLAPQYYAENIVFEDEDGVMEEDMTSYEFDAKYHNHPKHDEIKAKLIQRAAKVYPEFTRGEGDESKWFIKSNSPSVGEMKVSLDDDWVSFSGRFDMMNP
ncbi:MAG: hypothetical protein P8J32_05580, partial [bacterium]|nr:hypothetical protein [bacterium]